MYSWRTSLAPTLMLRGRENFEGVRVGAWYSFLRLRSLMFPSNRIERERGVCHLTLISECVIISVLLTSSVSFTVGVSALEGSVRLIKLVCLLLVGGMVKPCLLLRVCYGKRVGLP